MFIKGFPEFPGSPYRYVVQSHDYAFITLWIPNVLSHESQIQFAGQKHERIISLEPEVKKGHILFSPANISYNNQVKDYNKGGRWDDTPDSLYGAVQLVQGVGRSSPKYCHESGDFA